MHFPCNLKSQNYQIASLFFIFIKDDFPLHPMHYLISRASTLKTSSCLCFSSMIVFFHVIVTLASSVPYTQLGDSSCLQASLSIRSPRGSMRIWLGQALCRPTFPLLAAVLRMTRIPPSSAQFPNCSKEKLFLRQFLLCGPIGMALEHLCHADGWRWSFSPHLTCTSISNHISLLVSRKRVCTLWFFSHCTWWQCSTIFEAQVTFSLALDWYLSSKDEWINQDIALSS